MTPSILSALETLALRDYKKRYGEWSSIECLALAIEDERIAKECGAFDPASRRFYQCSRELFDYAILQEKLGY